MDESASPAGVGVRGRPSQRSAGQLDHPRRASPSYLPPSGMSSPPRSPRRSRPLRVPDPAAGSDVPARPDPQGDPAAHPCPAGCGTSRPRAAGSTPAGRRSHQPQHVPAAGRPTASRGHTHHAPPPRLPHRWN